MTAISVSAPFPILTDIDGSPLDAGYVYIGQANLDPAAFPKAAYWDASLTTPAAQPIRTSGGYPVRNGSPARIYTDGDYSIRINNKNGTLVYSSPASTDRLDSWQIGYDGGTVQDVLDDSKPMANYTALRNYTGRATSIRITQIGLAGFFQRLAVGDTDYSASDDGGVIIVDAVGRRWKRLYDGAVQVTWFGAKAQTGFDNSLAIQAAINYVCSTGANVRRQLHFSTGSYEVYQNIVSPLTGIGLTAAQKITISGNGRWNNGSTIVAKSAAVTKLFEFADIAESAANNDIAISLDNISLNGSELAGSGIWGASIAHASFRDTFITGFVDYGAFISGTTSAGYCNFFDDAVFYNNGIGLAIGGAPNQNLFSHSKFWANDIGVDFLVGGYANKFINCLFESNTKLAARVMGSGVSFDTCYFENNSTVGVDMVTPAFNMKADIYVKGGSSNTILEVFSPSTNVEAKNCFTQAGDAVNGCFIFASAVTNLLVENNVCKSNAQVPLVRTYFNSAYSFLRKASARNNTDFSTELDLYGYSNTLLLSAARSLNWWKSDKAQLRNYANTELNTWTVNGVLGGNGGTWSRSAEKYKNLPVWDLTWTVTSLTYYARFSIDVSDYPELAGKRVAFSLAMKSSGAGTVTFTPTAFSATAPLPTSWEFRTVIFDMPASGATSVGFAFTGLNGTVSVSAPTLYELGADAELLTGQIEPQRQFYGSAAPTAGSWLRGDIVWNTAPSAGGVPGWSNVAAGAPGTWKAMAALAA